VTPAVQTVIDNSTTMSVDVDEHEDAVVEFPCSAQSDDSTPVSVKWYRVDEDNDDEEIALSDVPDKLSLCSNGSLIIRLAENDTRGWVQFHGQYICRASNSYSEAERVAFIRVRNYVPPGQ